MAKITALVTSGRLRVYAIAALVCMAFAAFIGQASAAGVTLEGKQFSEPLGEYVGSVGSSLVSIIVAGFAGMALVALGLTAWKLGKRLMKSVV